MQTMWSLDDLIDAEAVLDAHAELEELVSAREQLEHERSRRRYERAGRAMS